MTLQIQTTVDKNKTAEDPLKLKYVRRFRFFMNLIGLWPANAVGEKQNMINKIPTLLSLPLCSTYIFGGCYYLRQNYDVENLAITVEVIVAMVATFVTMYRMYLPLTNRYARMVVKYFKEIHLIHYKHLSDFHCKTYQTIEKYSDRFTTYTVVLMLNGTFFFNLAPAYQNYVNGWFTKNNRRGPPEFSVHLLYPGFDPNDHIYFMTVINIYSSGCFAFSVTLIDLLMCLMVIHMIGHMKILVNNINEIRNISVEEEISGVSSSSTVCKLLDKDSNDLIADRLKLCVREHVFILQLAEDMSTMFGPLLGINYLQHIIGCCLLLFECSLAGLETVSRFAVLSFVIFAQLVQTSVIFEFVGIVSEELSSAVYNVPWEQMNVSNRRILLPLLQRMQKPITIYAFGTIRIGLQSMTEIFKTTYSYFMFLSTKTG